MESCTEYASRGYWEGRYAKQLQVKATDMEKGPAQSEDPNSGGESASGELAFEWLCEFSDLKPLLVHLLRPDKVDSLAASHMCPPQASEHPPECGEDSKGPESRLLPPHGVPGSNSINNLVAMLKNFTHSSSMHQATALDDNCSDPDLGPDPSRGRGSPGSTSHRGYAVLDLGAS